MLLLGLNGSPRRHWNTARMLESALDAARARGAQTELIHLHALDYKGCSSCLACKRPGGERRCHVRDGLTPVLEKAWAADALVLGTPVYLWRESGTFACFWERFIFPWLTYGAGSRTWATRSIKSGLIYTMNITREAMESACAQGEPMEPSLRHAAIMKRTFGEDCRVVYACDTTQVDDYAAYAMTRFDPRHKRQVRDEQFPHDLAAAAELGAWLAS